MTSTKVCTHCGVDKDISSFNRTNGYTRKVCGSCLYLQRLKTRSHAGRMTRRLARLRERRITPEFRAYNILSDMMSQDRRNNLGKHSVSIDWIEEQISKPCSYCKQQLPKQEMTLDRIDNNLGHFPENMVTACRICNYFRRDMPHQAWVILAENMPKVVEMGLLEGWSAGAGLRGKRKE